MDSLIKKFIAEILGTFVFLGVIITVVNKKSLQFSEVTNSFKIGLSLTIAICLFGSVSGGNFNPAVSFMLYMNKQLTTNELFVYILGQIIGALLAYYIFHLVIK